MNKKQQESVLMGALSGRTFTLRADALGDKVVEDSLRGLFPDGWLRVEDAELTSDDGAITVTGRASVFRVPTATLTVTFLLGDTPALVLSASSFPMTWTLAESFPGTKGSFLDSVIFRNPVIGLDTRARDALPRDFQHQFGLARNPAALEDYVLRGLSLEADVSLASVDSAAWALSAVELRLSGPMELKSGVPRFWLRSEPLPAAQFGSFSLPVEMQLIASLQSEPAAQPGQAGGVSVQAFARLAATATYQSGGKGAFELPVAAMIDDPIMAQIVFEVGTEDLSRLATDALVEAIGANDFMKGLDGAVPALESLSLSRVAIKASPLQRRITSLQVDVRVDKTIVFDEDLLTLGGFTFRFGLGFGGSDGATRLVASTVFDATLLDAGCTGSMTLPRMQMSAELKPGESIDVERLVDQLLPQLKGPPLECTGLRFYGGLRDHSLSLYVDLAGEWRVPIGPTGLGIDRLSLHMARSGGQTTGFVAGDLRIAGVALNTRWQVPGGLVLQAAIDELNMLETIESVVGKRALDGLPLSLGFLDTVLSDVNVGVDFTRNTFNLGATADGLGRAELFVQKADSGWGFGLGVYLGQGFKLSTLHKSLDVLDGFALQGPYVVLSSFTARTLALPSQPQRSSTEMQRGLNLHLPATLKPTGALKPLRKILGDDGASVTLSGALTTDGVRVEGALAGFELSKGVSFESAGSRVAVAKEGATSFALFGRVLVKTRDELRFTGDLVTQPTGASLSATMEGTWDEPFGIDGLSLADVALTVGINASGLPTVGIAGTTRIGSFDGSFALLLNSIDPMASAVVLKFNELSLGMMLESVLSPKVREDIPEQLWSVVDSGYEDVDIYLVPKSTYIGQNYYPQGFRFKGTTNLLGWRAQVDAKLGYTSGLKLQGSTEPLRLIKIKNKYVFELSASRSNLFKDVDAASKGEPQAFDAETDDTSAKPPEGVREADARPSALGGPQLRVSLGPLEPPSFLLSSRASLLGVTQDVLAQVDASGAKFSLLREDPLSRFAVSCTAGKSGLAVDGSLDFDLDLDLDLKIPGTGESLGRVKLKTRLSSALTLSIDGEAFYLDASASFRWKGTRLKVPKIVVTVAISDVEDVIKQVTKKLKDEAHDIFKSALGSFDEYWDKVEDGAIELGKSIGQEAEQVGKALRAGFKELDGELAGEAMKALDYSPEDTAKALRSVFKTSPADVADFLEDSWKQSDKQIKKIMKSAGFNEKEIERATKKAVKAVSNAATSTGKAAKDAAKKTRKKSRRKLKKLKKKL